MAASTGPILAIGAITVVNQSVLHDEPIDWRVPIATGFTAMGWSLFEKGNAKFAVGTAWIALVTVLFVRLKPGVKSPMESMLDYWNKG